MPHTLWKRQNGNPFAKMRRRPFSSALNSASIFSASLTIGSGGKDSKAEPASKSDFSIPLPSSVSSPKRFSITAVRDARLTSKIFLCLADSLPLSFFFFTPLQFSSRAGLFPRSKTQGRFCTSSFRPLQSVPNIRSRQSGKAHSQRFF